MRRFYPRSRTAVYYTYLLQGKDRTELGRERGLTAGGAGGRWSHHKVSARSQRLVEGEREGRLRVQC